MTSDEQPPVSSMIGMLNLLYRHRWVILAAMTVCGALAVWVALRSPNVYKVEVVLVASEQSGSSASAGSLLNQVSGLASLVGVAGGATDMTSRAMATLESRKFIERFISDRGLLPVLFASEWDAAEKRWLEKPRTLYDGYQKIIKDVLFTDKDKVTAIVTVSLEWTDPVVAADWANDLVNRLNEALKTDAVESAGRSITYLEAQARTAQNMELRQTIYRVIEANVKQQALASVSDAYAFHVIDPAAAPDTDDFVRPKRILYPIVGVICGLIFVCIAILGWDLSRQLLRIAAMK